jgi:hypothetical protein
MDPHAWRQERARREAEAWRHHVAPYQYTLTWQIGGITQTLVICASDLESLWQHVQDALARIHEA